MIIRLITIGLIAAILPLKAQQNFASISFGASIPMGEYGDTDDLSSSGYARPGGTIKFDVAYFPVSYLGLGGTLSYGSNYSQGQDLLEDVVVYLQENASDIIDIPGDATTSYASGFWNYFNLFIGPHFSIRATQRLYFDVRILAGATIIRLPDQELQISFDDTTIHNTTSGSKVTFGFTAGGGVRFKLNENLALKLAADYSRSPANLTYDFRLFTNDVVGEVPPVDASFPLQMMEFSAGLAYAF